jgi:Transglycosylase-like domain
VKIAAATLTMLGLALGLAEVSGAAEGCGDSRSPILCQTQQLREETWEMQDAMGEPRTPTSYSDRKSESEDYREWVRDYWRELRDEVKKRYDDGWGIVNAAWPRAADWDSVAQCETGQRWDWNSGTFQGALGIHYAAWDEFRYGDIPSEGYLASRLEQMLVAERIYNTHGIYAWGCGGAA